MNVLALDGALGVFSVAIARDDRVVTALSEGGNVALERGLGAIDDALAQAALQPDRIDRLAVGIGPGRFTGLRIAIAYAKSLAAVWKRPLVPISSFDLLEFGHTFERVLATVEGRPGVISARYRNGTMVRRASGRIAEVLAAVVPDDPDAGTLHVVGGSKDVLQALAERALLVRSADPIVTPAAAAAALVASSRALRGGVHEVRADYGELPAAKPPKH